MKRLLLILMLLALPIQASWAAAAAYCQHEDEAQTRHFGHHEHKHEHESAHADDEKSESQLKFHPDCVTCHGLAASIVSIPFADTGPFPSASQAVAVNNPSLKSIPSSRPEKPQWVFAA